MLSGAGGIAVEADSEVEVGAEDSLQLEFERTEVVLHILAGLRSSQGHSQFTDDLARAVYMCTHQLGYIQPLARPEAHSKVELELCLGENENLRVVGNLRVAISHWDRKTSFVAARFVRF